jgi:hypothetical protein
MGASSNTSNVKNPLRKSPTSTIEGYIKLDKKIKKKLKK